MFTSDKFSTLLFVAVWLMVAPLALAIKVDLPDDVILLEADAGEMEKGVDIVNVDGASEGKATDHERGSKTIHEIDIPEAGIWYLWIRIFCPNGDQDSYWIGIDGADPDPPEDALGEAAVRIYSAAGDSVNIPDQPFNIWFWDAGKGNADPRSLFEVKNSGKHTLWSKGRETGTLLDQILLTMDENFNPEEASRGEAIDPPVQAIEPQSKLAVTWGNIKS